MADLTVEFEPEDGHWEVSDYTSDDYSTYRFRTVWDEEYNLLEFWLNRRRAEKILEDPNDDDNKRCKLAYSRHQKKLLQTTGVIEGPDLQNMELFVLQDRSYTGMGIPVIQRVTAERITLKQIKTQNWNYNKHEVFYCPVTPETEEMVKEYNEAISEFLGTLKGFRGEIFGTRCSACGEYAVKHKYLIKTEDWPLEKQRWERYDREFDSFTCYDLFTKRNNIEKKPSHEIT